MLTLLKTLYKLLWFELIWLSGIKLCYTVSLKFFLVMNSKSRIWNLENILENTNSSCSKLMLAQVHLLAFPVQHRPSLLKLMHLWPKMFSFFITALLHANTMAGGPTLTNPQFATWVIISNIISPNSSNNSLS